MATMSIDKIATRAGTLHLKKVEGEETIVWSIHLGRGLAIIQYDYRYISKYNARNAALKVAKQLGIKVTGTEFHDLDRKVYKGRD